MRWFLSWGLPALLMGCGDGVNRDADGCWVDAEQAQAAILWAECQVTCADPEYVQGVGFMDCLVEPVDVIEARRPYECFNGCGVDACVGALDEYNQTCDTGVVGWTDANPCLNPDTIPFYSDGDLGLSCQPEDGMGW